MPMMVRVRARLAIQPMSERDRPRRTAREAFFLPGLARVEDACAAALPVVFPELRCASGCPDAWPEPFCGDAM
jgi:hypothetical protein